MNQKQKFRLAGILSILVIIGIALSLVLYALKQNINLFYTPTQLMAAHVTPTQVIRMGGYVAKKSVKYDSSGTFVTFTITDRKNSLIIHYHGVLPNLFREGQSVVVTGKLTNSDFFTADQVLAKHDEKYMPPMLAKELKEQGKLE